MHVPSGRALPESPAMSFSSSPNFRVCRRPWSVRAGNMRLFKRSQDTESDESVVVGGVVRAVGWVAVPGSPSGDLSAWSKYHIIGDVSVGRGDEIK
eukprot:2296837-Heterocapsa_arctica.AAC.1